MTSMPGNRERIRRLIVKLIFIIYGLLILEGILRKWMFPAYHKYLFFIRDPFVLLVYCLALTNRMWPRKTHIFSFGTLLAVLFFLLVFLQGISTSVNIVTLVYGWRMYFFYFPLAFIIGEQFTDRDLKCLLKYTLLIALPMAGLVLLQHFSSPRAFINKTAGEAGGIIYTITGQRGGSVVRPTGTFTFFHGHQLFIGSIAAFAFALWVLPPKERPMKKLVLLFSSGAVLVNLAMSGTRLPYILTILICAATVFSGSLVKKQKMSFRAKAFPILIVIVGMLVLTTFFSAVYESTVERHRGAEMTEGSVAKRGTRMFFTFADFLSKAPILGAGIGSQTSGGSALARGTRSFKGAVEDEWSRIIIEVGPIFGFLYIYFRIALVLWLFKNALKATRRSSNALPLLLVAFIGIIILIWNVTNYGTENGYAWLFAGFCIAANRLGPGTWETGDRL